MKISNQKLLEDIQKLGGVAQKQLPVKVSYAISKNISKIESELKIYDKERQKLIEKYGEKDEQGKVVADEKGQIKFKDKDSWDKDIKALLDIENEIDIHKFSIDELNGFNISAAELQVIDYMIDDK
ncbi:hypothetical protein CPAST_c40210 [Clostridium pasteurianum DSM 525 = ATCC 6013]|uniref:Phage protein n=1 Tax=Clostridium pasteurianum DSM 525 = ATCC 6013 TaxID=1262449 RepID=A0A0H3JBN7_CLOPA|nr:hypothetical protein [Clostridium pasteurianum]AJA50050.1 hypothetical protein CPAST_c40210 [Clostridium pasteurianum DSM 525 = ATCC 6013]AJA54038.1 hypothetical protein CLPA_c40210 [Clostridium pasteurianum DSM 525 = ATCC 6013]AOZ77176.1 hypothetical protein AQ983_19550 [Clostridium pasteurianum DSM 525 = ATCC 6013]AOZ80973.1 hypothetical protein AQ984_19545 [Clostridium pasteurianum]ELP59245.1 hypothetical protein F502_10203 [Clostridium pasteurianum DSM 525 = ATCC 6013]